jgi:two-component system chemotaxis sensor kinase CheA
LITDDGAGMNADVLRRKAVEKGMYDQDGANRLTDRECYNLIFTAGFSTKDQISDVSGRGVGMDVVKTKISQLNGQLSVLSKLGEGSSIVIKVPLTLAIMPTLMIMLADQSFALPLVNVVEIFHLDLSKTNVVDGRECVVVRDKVFPLFHIKRWLIRGGVGNVEPKNGHVVIVSMGTRQVGFVVDQLVGQEEVVIKPLGRGLQGTPGMAGATITGDGRIALIIDVPSLLQHYS